jgi:hypothetical protein
MADQRKQRTEESHLNDVLAGDDELGRDEPGPDGQASEARTRDEGNSNRREIPGGSFHPAKTPGAGATGPSTRDTDRAVVGDVNETLLGQVDIAGGQVTPQRQENDPDR